MFYGALFSGYVLLRAGSAIWETPWRAGLAAEWSIAVDHWFRTMWLGFAVMQSRRLSGEGVPIAGLPRFSWLVAPGRHGVRLAVHLRRRLARLARALPASSVPLACWYALTGTVALLVAGGAIAAVWVALEPVPALPARPARCHAAALLAADVGRCGSRPSVGLYLDMSRSSPASCARVRSTRCSRADCTPASP